MEFKKIIVVPKDFEKPNDNSIKGQLKPKIDKVDKNTVHRAEKNLAHEINIHRFTKTVLMMNSIGWVLESFVTGLIIKYLYKINPGIIWRSVNRI